MLHHLSFYLLTRPRSGILVLARQNLVNRWSIESNWKNKTLVLECGSFQDKQKESWSINLYCCWRGDPFSVLHRLADECVLQLRGQSSHLCWLWTTFVYFWSSADWFLLLATLVKLCKHCNLCWLLGVSLRDYIKFGGTVQNCPIQLLLRL